MATLLAAVGIGAGTAAAISTYASLTAVALSAVSSVATAVSTVKAGQAAEEQAKAQSKHFAQQANLARAQAATEAAQRERAARRRIAGVSSGFASSGIAQAGSPLDVLSDVAFEEELGVALTLNAGEHRAQALEFESAFSRFSGRTARKQAYAQAVIGGTASSIGMGTSILGGG